jgi:hypothetical protein
VIPADVCLVGVEVDPILVADDAANVQQEASKQRMSKKERDFGTLQ